MKTCVCGSVIDPDRVAAIPNVRLCVACATENGSSRKGYMVYSHKTAPVLMFVDTSDREAMRLADRAHRRSR